MPPHVVALVSSPHVPTRFPCGEQPFPPAQALSLSASPSLAWPPASSSCSHIHTPGKPERNAVEPPPRPHLLKAGRPTVFAQVSSMTVDAVLFSPHASPFEYVTMILSSETHSDGKAVRSHTA